MWQRKGFGGTERVEGSEQKELRRALVVFFFLIADNLANISRLEKISTMKS